MESANKDPNLVVLINGEENHGWLLATSTTDFLRRQLSRNPFEALPVAGLRYVKECCQTRQISVDGDC